jgi:hypothetical protein
VTIVAPRQVAPTRRDASHALSSLEQSLVNNASPKDARQLFPAFIIATVPVNAVTEVEFFHQSGPTLRLLISESDIRMTALVLWQRRSTKHLFRS